MAPKRLSFSVNPLWSHYVAVASVAFALLLGAARYFITDRTDPLHCDALLTEGRWLDDKWKNWQPGGCMMYTYQPTDISTCLATRRVVFIGDSVTRQLFFQLLHIADPALPVAPPDDTRKHADHTFTSSTGIHFTFIWDPYLNSSQAQSYINPPGAPSSPSIASPPSPDPEHNRPALLVLGSGLWYLRYAEAGSGGLPAWEAQMEATLAALAHGHAADTAVVLPIEDVIPAKLDRARAASMHASDIDAMNSDLLHRIRPPARTDPYAFFPGWGAEPRLDPGMAKGRRLPVSLPLVFNKMLDESQTADGLHFSDAVVRAQAQVLLNARCNDALPKTFPLDKTCCNAYPRPAPLYALVLAAAILWGPVVVLLSRRVGSRAPGQPFIADHEMPAVVFSAAAVLIYLADRTGFWLKEQKQFSPWTFSFLGLLSLVAGLLTVRRADKDLGFLNREQTDEWKGWMQIAILIYHYTGASKVSGIYNPIRVLVASYLFMTGYGHTTYYVRKADFGFTRIAQILTRLNLLTILLAYLMNTDYLSYYFAPLVSWWFLVIYVTMALGSQYNERTVFLVGKIVVSMVFVAWFMGEAWILEAIFQFLERVCGIHWSAREWSFRVNLDLWIVYVGMLTALSVIKIREHRLTDHPQWPLATKVASGASALALLWFLAFELMQSDKFAYNRWHPYVSFLPVLAFVVLRNATGILRSASSRMFAFVGTCSLETFIIQYHLWLAGDTKGILLVIPGTRWRPANLVLTTIVFVYVSHRVAQATGEVTNWVCGTGKPQTLPTTAEPAPSSSRRAHAVTPAGEGEVIFLVSQDGEQRKDNDGNDLPPEPDTPARPPRRWVDRLAEESSASQSSSPGFRVWYGETEWQPGVGTKLAIAAVTLWLLNIMWPYPPA
ncbi:Cas1p-domain-containing protein [Wolfiporia cocos MD-104 SS10]|uniref:Cas1p-domain-containing protein n=1 Tax=Wolfiporia cocos (strain MD-104) TaxID=742152 RepID=A0A2H3IVX5_WOLCO|nr:Cas1p-domain-containing protein [Wolfiporia cocos MD-104 SS10]